MNWGHIFDDTSIFGPKIELLVQKRLEFQMAITFYRVLLDNPANICWSSRRLEDVFKTCVEDVFNTSSA